MQQEKDFKNAVQPDSPISALLKSARQPLVQAPTGIKETALLRKLSAAGAQSTLSPVRRSAAKPSCGAPVMDRLGEEEEEEEEEDEAVREKVLATQKARIVSQMASSGTGEPGHVAAAGPSRRSPRKQPLGATMTVPQATSTAFRSSAPDTKGKVSAPTGKPANARASLFDIVGQTLENAFQMAQTGAGFTSPGKHLDP